jgi:hypothetical protein
MIRPELIFKDSVRFSGPLKDSVKHWIIGIFFTAAVIGVIANLLYALGSQ